LPRRWTSSTRCQSCRRGRSRWSHEARICLRGRQCRSLSWLSACDRLSNNIRMSSVHVVPKVFTARELLGDSRISRSKTRAKEQPTGEVFQDDPPLIASLWLVETRWHRAQHLIQDRIQYVDYLGKELLIGGWHDRATRGHSHTHGSMPSCVDHKGYVLGRQQLVTIKDPNTSQNLRCTIGNLLWWSALRHRERGQALSTY
jgi:hypothetical protein